MLVRKGQMSLEMLVTVSLVIMLSVPLLLILFVSSQLKLESTSTQQAKAVTNVLADSINEVYLEGEGSYRVVQLIIPSNTISINITDHEVIANLETTSGVYEVSSPFFANTLSGGTGTTGKGAISFLVEYTEDGVVISRMS